MVNIDWNPDKKKLREFGIVCFILFLILGIVFAITCGTNFLPFRLCLAGSGLGIVTFAVPYAMKWFYYCWMGFAFVMGNIIGHILLFLIYFVIVTIIGVVMKVVGRDRLDLKKKHRDSYWKKCTQIESDKNMYMQQF